MPLKVSSQGWVKVAPPPPKPKRRIDPEEKKEAFCSPLRYFACQAQDPSRERLRLLGGRIGFSSSEADLLRPHSRLERSSPLEEWRWDARPSRSSSRQSGNILEGHSPSNIDERGGSSSHNSRRQDAEIRKGDSERDTRDHSKSTHPRKRDRASSTPLIIPVSPPPSIYDEAQESIEAEIIQGDVYPDNVSVAFSETPSERHCRHNHRHSQSRKTPSVIPEGEENEPTAAPISSPASLTTPTARSKISTQQHIQDEVSSLVSIPAPPPSIARSDTYRSRKAEVDIPSSIPESAPLTEPLHLPSGAISEKPDGLDRSDAKSETSEISHRSKRSSKSSRSSRSSRSTDTYRSRRTESESDYSESVRSASPIRDHKHTFHDDDTSSYYPSPPPSPRLNTTRPRYEPPSADRSSLRPRNRVVTAPTPSSKPSPALSASSWSSSSSRSRSSTSSLSSRSTSSAPSIDGYQFQAAIFQPKHYQGYRAPSLSRGNRWETATSALSFD